MVFPAKQLVIIHSKLAKIQNTPFEPNKIPKIIQWVKGIYSKQQEEIHQLLDELLRQKLSMGGVFGRYRGTFS